MIQSPIASSIHAVRGRNVNNKPERKIEKLSIGLTMAFDHISLPFGDTFDMQC